MGIISHTGVKIIDRGLTLLLLEIGEGLDNNQIIEDTYPKIISSLKEFAGKSGPFDRLEEEVEYFKDKFLLNKLGVFEPFTVGKKTINPKNLLDNLVREGNLVYSLFVNKALGEAYCKISNSSYKSLTKEIYNPDILNTRLKRLDSLLEYAGQWILHLYDKEGIVGEKIKDKLKEDCGISDPSTILPDIKKISKNLRDRLTNAYLIDESILE